MGTPIMTPIILHPPDSCELRNESIITIPTMIKTMVSGVMILSSFIKLQYKSSRLDFS